MWSGQKWVWASSAAETAPLWGLELAFASDPALAQVWLEPALAIVSAALSAWASAAWSAAWSSGAERVWVLVAAWAFEWVRPWAALWAYESVCMWVSKSEGV